jgi:hypothetical protein
LEIEIPLGGNRFPAWKSKSSTMEMFLRFGGGKSSWWKRSSNLEEENHRGGNVPPIWRKKIIVVEMFLRFGGRKSSCFCGEIPSLARQKSLTKLKTRGYSIYW